jgi:hypothetical protein
MSPVRKPDRDLAQAEKRQDGDDDDNQPYDVDDAVHLSASAISDGIRVMERV